MKPLAHKYFVQGVKAFELPTPLHEQPEEKDPPKTRAGKNPWETYQETHKPTSLYHYFDVIRLVVQIWLDEGPE